MPEPEKLGRFGHHPDSEIDACVEIEKLEGWLAECHAVMLSALDLSLSTEAGRNFKSNIRRTLLSTGLPGPWGEVGSPVVAAMSGTARIANE